MPSSQDIHSLHALYVRLSGLPVRLDMAREHTWFQWLRYGFTADDLKLVISHLQREIKRGNRNPGALKFHNLVGCPDYFEEDLAAARAAQSTTQPDRAAARRPTGRHASQPPPDARSIEQIIAGLEKLKTSLKYGLRDPHLGRDRG